MLLTTSPISPISSPFANPATTSYVPPISAAATAKPTPTASTSVLPTASSVSDATQPGGLSQIALYGIIGGGAALGVLIIGIIAFCCVKRRKEKAAEREWWTLKEGNESRTEIPSTGVISNYPGEKEGWSNGGGEGFTPTNPNFQFNRSQFNDNRSQFNDNRPQYNDNRALANTTSPSYEPQRPYGDFERRNAEAAASRAQLFDLPQRTDSRSNERSNYSNPNYYNGPSPNQGGARDIYPPSSPEEMNYPIPQSHRPYSKALPPTRPHYRPSEVPKGAKRYLEQAPPLPSAPPLPREREMDNYEQQEDDEGLNFMDVMLRGDRDTIIEPSNRSIPEATSNRSQRRKSLAQNQDNWGKFLSFCCEVLELLMRINLANLHATNSIPVPALPPNPPPPGTPASVVAKPTRSTSNSQSAAKPVRSPSRRVRPPIPSPSIDIPPSTPITNGGAVNEVIVPNLSKMELISSTSDHFEELNDHPEQERDRFSRIDSLRDLEDILETFDERGRVIRSTSNASNTKFFNPTNSRTVGGGGGTQPLNLNKIPEISYTHSVASSSISRSGDGKYDYEDRGFEPLGKFGKNERSVTEDVYGSYGNASLEDLNDLR